MNTKQGKIQSLIVKHLLENGTLDIMLPDGIVLEIGIVHEDKNKSTRKNNDYCYVSAQQDGRRTLIDSFNLGLSFPDSEDALIIEDKTYNDKGEPLHRVEVV